MARNNVGYATDARIQLIAPIGAAGIRPISIMNINPVLDDRSASISGTQSSGTQTHAHAAQTHRGLAFALSAASARPFPTMSPALTIMIARKSNAMTSFLSRPKSSYAVRRNTSGECSISP